MQELKYIFKKKIKENKIKERNPTCRTEKKPVESHSPSSPSSFIRSSFTPSSISHSIPLSSLPRNPYRQISPLPPASCLFLPSHPFWSPLREAHLVLVHSKVHSISFYFPFRFHLVLLPPATTQQDLTAADSGRLCSPLTGDGGFFFQAFTVSGLGSVSLFHPI